MSRGAFVRALLAVAAVPYFFGAVADSSPSAGELAPAAAPARGSSKSWALPPHSSMHKGRRKLRVARRFRPRRR